MSIDPINADDTDATPAPDSEQGAEQAAPQFTPSVGDVVRLDDPGQEGEPSYGLYVADGMVVQLPAAQRYELQVYPAG